MRTGFGRILTGAALLLALFAPAMLAHGPALATTTYGYELFTDAIGEAPATYAITGGGRFDSTQGPLYLNASVNGSPTFSHATFSITTLGAKTLGQNLRVTRVGWNSAEQTLTVLGTVSWKGSDAPITIRCTQGGVNTAVLNVIIEGSAPVSVFGRTTGFMSLHVSQ